MSIKFNQNIFVLKYCDTLWEFINDFEIHYYSSKELKIFFLWQIMQNVLILATHNLEAYEDYIKTNKVFNFDKFIKFFD